MVSRRELLDSVRGLLALLVGLVLSPLVSFAWVTSRARDRPGKPWADLGPASKLEGEAWQRRTLQAERTNRWRHEVQEEVVYLRRRGELVEALSAICPHAGCLVKPGDGGFVCPCHRSLFDAEGEGREGPSPRPLDRLDCKVERGRLFVKYQRFRPGARSREPLEA